VGPATEAGTPAASFGEAKRAGVADGSAEHRRRSARCAPQPSSPARRSREPGRAPRSAKVRWRIVGSGPAGAPLRVTHGFRV